jgi:hypothetical protein
MQKIITGLFTIGVLALGACNSGNNSSSATQDTTTAGTAATTPADTTAAKPVAEITPQFTDVNPKIAAAIKTVTDNYLGIKNALAGDNDKEAASGGKAMATALTGVDASLFTPEQKKIYTENEDDLKEHAEHIGKNAGNIKHQREHFAKMSEDVYTLVKAFGGGRLLYHDFCPMYNDNKGALWLSETEAIKNPYMGSEMPTCGVVEEKIK